MHRTRLGKKARNFWIFRQSPLDAVHVVLTMTTVLAPLLAAIAFALPLKAADQASSVQPGSGNSFKDCPECPEMVVVPSGSFMMGSTQAEIYDLNNRYNTHSSPWYRVESPQHKVTISKPFAAGKFSVTFDEWDTCVADGSCEGYKPSDQGWGRGMRPVINVSWNEAKTYVEWLSKKSGKTYRLLSEAEREYVTRAGSTTPFWWGSSISTDQANYNGYYTFGGGRKGECRQKTVPVDSFKPNPWGLYQVHGNVREWVEDCGPDNNYKNAPQDGSAATASQCEFGDAFYVLRGGSAFDYPWDLRAAARSGSARGNRDNLSGGGNGFRVARTITP
jgi:formylglycine-generating enzyme required for sulfatase activity